MRRDDRKMDKDFAYEIIDKAEYGVVSLIDEEGQAYGVPLSLARKEDTLYFHSAKEGKKVDAFKKGPRVWINFIGQVQVPELYSRQELEEMEKDNDKLSLLLNNVFTTEFESTMVQGKVEEVEDSDGKIEALKTICQKYTPDKMDYADAAIKASYDKVNIYKINMEKISSKRKKYDDEGKEIKANKQ